MAKWSTFQIDKPYLQKLRIIAAVMKRSMAGQVRFMVDREWENLKKSGLLKTQDIEEEDNASSL